MNEIDKNQKLAIKKLSKLKAGALFMKMGTGKTKVALDLVKSRQDYYDIVIWIAPASLLRERNYLNEIKKWSDGLNKDIYYFTSEGISQSDVKYLECYNLAENNRVFCVVDESILFKNLDSKRTSRLIKLRNMFDFRIILNGTPVSKNLLDLHAQMEFVSPKILNMTEIEFAENFLEYEKGSYRPWRRWSKPANEEALIEMIRPYIFDAELDIPIKCEVLTQEFELDDQESSRYENLKSEVLKKQLDKINFLAMTQKLQKEYTISKEKYKFIKKLDHKKRIYFVKFLQEVDDLLQILPKSAEFTGRAKTPIEDFKSDKVDNLICTYGTGSFGLNMQFCDEIVFFSQTFDWKDKEQALHRIYRFGQDKDVVCRDFYVKVGLEQIIRKSLSKKENTATNVQKIVNEKGVKAL